MQNTAIFPGSFDPFTVGHESIVNRALSIFDRIIVSVGYNSSKQGYFPLETRLEWIGNVFKNEPRVEVTWFSGLTVDFCRKKDARFILRGLRTAADFEFERAIAQVNKAMDDSIESVFLLTRPEHTPVNSTIVRDIVRHGGDASKFVPPGVKLAEFKP
ncbi:MAG: pantetheine-phosphate adenylyltransferase [Marinilabiliales bacterium]|nr:MAG: pantetheine-phosphate adenylyltransferase [Marinilabiliales bacterium]